MPFNGHLVRKCECLGQHLVDQTHEDIMRDFTSSASGCWLCGLVQRVAAHLPELVCGEFRSVVTRATTSILGSNLNRSTTPTAPKMGVYNHRNSYGGKE
eukprot:6492397-Amphidinium_carterae.3